MNCPICNTPNQNTENLYIQCIKCNATFETRNVKIQEPNYFYAFEAIGINAKDYDQASYISKKGPFYKPDPDDFQFTGLREHGKLFNDNKEIYDYFNGLAEGVISLPFKLIFTHKLMESGSDFEKLTAELITISPYKNNQVIPLDGSKSYINTDSMTSVRIVKIYKKDVDKFYNDELYDIVKKILCFDEQNPIKQR